MGYRKFSIDLLPDGTLSVRFPYDERMLSVIREIPGRKWAGAKNSSNKYWTIPRSSLRTLLEQSARAGIDHAATETVQKAVALGVERKQELKRVRVNDTPLDLPTDTVPYVFQTQGIHFLRYALQNFKGALLADDMGLGKTFQSLAVIVQAKSLRRVLVLCPATLKYVWEAEIQKHFPQLTSVVIDGAADKRAVDWVWGGAQIVIANYDLIYRDPEPRALEWDLVIFDEATRLKNFRTKTHKMCKKLHARYRLGLSGLPIENELADLHSLFAVVVPGVLPSWWVFSHQHCEMDQWGTVTGYKGVEQVKEKVAPYLLRRRKVDVLPDLPDKIYSDFLVDLSPDEWAVYEAVSQAIITKLADVHSKLIVQNVLTEMLRLKQITDDAALVDVDLGFRSAKNTAVAEILEAAGQRKVVFFTQFAQMAARVGETFGLPVIQGSVSAKDRAEIIRDFQYPVSTMRGLVSTDAGAYGVTLTAADIVVHIDLPWNPARVRQREDRLHRIGQKNAVQVVTLMARNTIDWYVRGILDEKMQIVKAILEEGEYEMEAAKTITRADLLGLLGVSG